MTELREEVYKYTWNDEVDVGSDHENHNNNEREICYNIRGLTEDEIPAWTEFCASVFAYKPNPPPPSYFARHYTNDPTHKASLIRAAFTKNGSMVASCRLFLRRISNGAGASLSAGGIGEVCTDKHHRRRGLSKVLLQNVLDIMRERKLQVSLLHAAPLFFQVYEKAGGYVNSTSRWSSITSHRTYQTNLNKIHNNKHNSQYSVRLADFPNDTESLSRLHRIYSEQQFAGCVVRSQEYWNDYLSVELEGSLWVLVKEQQKQQEVIVAWLSIRSRGDKFQLQEFGIDANHITTNKALVTLLTHAIQQQQAATTTSTTTMTFSFSVPTVVLDQLRSEEQKDLNLESMFDWSSETSDDDLGWMYKILEDGGVTIDSIDGTTASHLIWPSDSF